MINYKLRCAGFWIKKISYFLAAVIAFFALCIIGCEGHTVYSIWTCGMILIVSGWWGLKIGDIHMYTKDGVLIKRVK